MKEPVLVDKAYAISDINGELHFYFNKSLAENHLREEQNKFDKNKSQLKFKAR